MTALRSVTRVRVMPRGGRYELRLVLGRRRMRALAGGDDAIVASFSEDDDGQVAIEILAAGAAPPEAVDRAIEQAIGIAGLDDDPGDFPRLARAHPTLARLHRRYEGARLGRTATVFESFAASVIEQLVTFDEARAARNRMVQRYGARVPGSTLIAFPTAEAVAKIPAYDLRALGVGLRRATTLLQGAARGRRLEALRARAPDDAMAALQSLRGVGPWTANKVAIEALGHADGVLVGDAGAPFVVTMALTGLAGGDDEMLACLEPYRPHRARVLELFHLAFVFEHAVPGVPRRAPPTIDPHRRRPWEG
ncbi:MAG: DNA-3-methyladenine glycosylase 2 family protein [Deltaproteobacteria bacterium]|nr:DNA-3-methyladenine glycosylase 2 family protein [Deltaproteobacteria bacterium]